MKHSLYKIALIVIDISLLILAFVIGYLLRFDLQLPDDMMPRLWLTLTYVIPIQYASLWLLGVPRFSWRYIGLRETSRILIALSLATVGVLIARYAFLLAGRYVVLASAWIIPLGALAIDSFLAFLGIVGARALCRVMLESKDRSRLRQSQGTVVRQATPVLLIGAGQAGLLVARELSARPDLLLQPVGFIDDDKLKHRSVIHGIPVLGDIDTMANVVQQKGVKQALITMANVPGDTLRSIASRCDAAGINPKVIPGLFEMVGGRINLANIRNINIEDLLRRNPVQLEQDVIESLIERSTVMVTGAGGSIGSELCRQIMRFCPARLILVEQAENPLFDIHRELEAMQEGTELIPCVASVCDSLRMRRLLETHTPRIIFHAAAHKHVPLMEWNPDAAIKNNILGTQTIATLAHELGVERFLLISTDKAVNPTSVMGTSKRLAELVIQRLSRSSRTRFAAVRFGNVLGSAGSVVPIFQRQIQEGGPVTITHPEMRRYFMTIPEACQLVLQASAMGEGGEVFILDMGEAVKIIDLAKDLVALSGLRLGDDIEIKITGKRPGEKLFEELSTDDEHADATRHPKVFVAKMRHFDAEALGVQLESLKGLLDATTSEEQLVRRLSSMVPESALQLKKAS